MDKITVTITSRKGEASGKPKFHAITKTNHNNQLIIFDINLIIINNRDKITATTTSCKGVASGKP